MFLSVVTGPYFFLYLVSLSRFNDGFHNFIIILSLLYTIILLKYFKDISQLLLPSHKPKIKNHNITAFCGQELISCDIQRLYYLRHTTSHLCFLNSIQNLTKTVVSVVNPNNSLQSKDAKESLVSLINQSIIQFSSVPQSCPILCYPMNHSMPALPVHHQLPEFTQTHVHPVSDAIRPFHPPSSPSPPAFNLSQHQGLFK